MKNYEDMPFRGKISVNAWSLEHYGVSDWSRESSRRYWRRYHNHYNPHLTRQRPKTSGAALRRAITAVIKSVA